MYHNSFSISPQKRKKHNLKGQLSFPKDRFLWHGSHDCELKANIFIDRATSVLKTGSRSSRRFRWFTWNRNCIIKRIIKTFLRLLLGSSTMQQITAILPLKLDWAIVRNITAKGFVVPTLDKKLWQLHYVCLAQKSASYVSAFLTWFCQVTWAMIISYD